MDIVDRLRSWFNYDLCDYIEPAIPDMKEAADEIENLRRKIGELQTRVINLSASLKICKQKCEQMEKQNAELSEAVKNKAWCVEGDCFVERVEAAVAKTTGGE